MDFDKDTDLVAQENPEFQEQFVPKTDKEENEFLAPGGAAGDMIFNEHPQVEQEDEDVEYNNSNLLTNQDEFNQQTRESLKRALTTPHGNVLTLIISVIILIIAGIITISSLLGAAAAIGQFYFLYSDIQNAEKNTNLGESSWGVILSRIFALFPPFVGFFVGLIGMIESSVIICSSQEQQTKFACSLTYLIALIAFIIVASITAFVQTLFIQTSRWVTADGQEIIPFSNMNIYLIWISKALSGVLSGLIVLCCCSVCCVTCPIGQLFSIFAERKKPGRVSL